MINSNYSTAWNALTLCQLYRFLPTGLPQSSNNGYVDGSCYWPCQWCESGSQFEGCAD